MHKILVIGAHGQVGCELRNLQNDFSPHQFAYVDKDDLDIADAAAVNEFISKGHFFAVINCAAYTAVDKAESEKETAYKVNAEAAGTLAKAAKAAGSRFVHISTDFIFDGSIARPLLEDDKPHPLSVYGDSKLKGEMEALSNNPDTLLIRTSWVYSSYGANFVKTILKLCREREAINVIYDQIGTPTYARDLALVILKLVVAPEWKPGVYNYSNEGVASWFDFAVAIRDIAALKTKISPIETSQYPTPATRPKYSLLNKAKIKSTFGIEIPYWRNSLEECMKLIK